MTGRGWEREKYVRTRVRGGVLQERDGEIVVSEGMPPSPRGGGRGMPACLRLALQSQTEIVTQSKQNELTKQKFDAEKCFKYEICICTYIHSSRLFTYIHGWI